MSPAPLTARDLRALAQRFRVLAVPARLRILQQLRGEPHHVTALIAATGLRQANLSKHLSVLHRHGLVARVRVGRFVRYAIADPAVLALCDVVCGQLAAGRRRRTAAAPTSPRRSRRRRSPPATADGSGRAE
jgi:DNA-binding transcriptional ArsR family regulator